MLRPRQNLGAALIQFQRRAILAAAEIEKRLLIDVEADRADRSVAHRDGDDAGMRRAEAIEAIPAAGTFLCIEVAALAALACFASNVAPSAPSHTFVISMNGRIW